MNTQQPVSLKIIVGTFILTLFSAFLSNDLYMPSMPSLVNIFSTSANMIQLTLSAWFFGNIVFQLVLGPVSDRYGNRLVLLNSVVLLIVGTLCCLLSHSIYQFLLGRFIQGIAVSGVMVAAFASLHDFGENDEQTTKIFAYVGMCTALAPVLGPLLGGYLNHFFGWKASFIVVVLLATVCYAMLYRYVRSNPKGAINTKRITHVLQSYKSLLLNSKYISTVLIYAVIFAGGSAFLTGAAFVYVEIFHLSSEYIGYTMIPIIGCYMIGTSLSSKLISRFSQQFLILSGILVASSSILTLYLLALHNNITVGGFVAFISAYYLGLGLCGPVLNTISLNHASECKGQGSAMLTFTMMSLSTVASATVSSLYNESVESVVLVILFCVALSVGLYLNSRRHFVFNPVSL